MATASRVLPELRARVQLTGPSPLVCIFISASSSPSACMRVGFQSKPLRSALARLVAQYRSSSRSEAAESLSEDSSRSSLAVMSVVGSKRDENRRGITGHWDRCSK
ncbi:hypothetical protein BJX99DRAFT_232171 [Aspergillus californicus]